MRKLLIAAVASLALAGCTTTSTFNPKTAEAACRDAQDAYEAYRAYVEEGGNVSAEARRKINAAKRTADRLCENPEQIDLGAILIAAAQIAALFGNR